MAKVARASRIPITTGERLTTKYDFARLIEHQAAAIFNLDIGQVGGILESKKIAAMAEAHYLQTSPHVWGGPLVAAASVQLALCCPNFLIMESIERFDGLHAELLDQPILWRDGYVIPPDRPGSGTTCERTPHASWHQPGQTSELMRYRPLRRNAMLDPCLSRWASTM